MISHPRWKAFAAAWLFLLAIAPSALPGAHARSASRSLRYFLHRNGQSGSSAGLRKLQSSRKATSRRALPTTVVNVEKGRGATGQHIRSIFPLMDFELSGGQHRLLPGNKESKGRKSSKGKGEGKGKGKGEGKGKGSLKSCKSGKGKGKGKGSSKGSCDELPNFCDKLDFRTGVGQIPPPEAYGALNPQNSKSSKNHRGLVTLQQRGLQFEGPLCETNVLDTARHIPNLSIFVSLMEQAGLDDIFLCAGPFTVLTPTNHAFAANPGLSSYLADLNHVEDLREVLLYHILPGLYLTDDFENGPIGTLQGEDVTVNVTSSSITFNGAELVEGDILACNGVLQVIDEVLIPPGFNVLPEICDSLDFDGVTQGALCEPNVLDTARRFPELSTFVQLVGLAGLDDIFVCSGPFTLLAPSNSAFDAIDPEVIRELLHPSNAEKLQDLLLYHIVPGLYLPAELEAGYLETLLVDQSVEVTLDPIMFNQKSGVVRDNIVACNGAIYILDDVLVPSTNFCDMFDYGGDASLNCIPSVLEVAASYPELTLVTALLERAELTEIFTCPGPFTLLLPSNSAFDEVDPVFLEFLLRPENQEALEDLLLYHIIPGSFPTTELVAGELETLLPGEVVTVEIMPVMFNDAAVLTPDIDACNGIIDIIDAVLLPFAPPTIPPVPGPTLTPGATSAPVVSGPTTVPAPLPTIAPTSFCTAFDFGNPEQGEQGCTPNVLEEARSIPDLSLAVILFERAELADIFTCPGSFTILFPTNSAIEMVDASLVEFLLQPENILELQNLMLYHVLPGYFPTSGLTNGQLIETLFPRRDVEVTVTPDIIMFNDATVVTSDTEACNGLIHTINQVLTFLPPRPTAAPSYIPTVSPATAETAAPSVAGAPSAPISIPTQNVTAAPSSSTGPIGAPAMPTASPVTAIPGAPTAAPIGTPATPTATPVTAIPGAPTTAPVAPSVTLAPAASSSFMPSLVTLAPAPVAQNATLAPAASSSLMPSVVTIAPAPVVQNATLAPAASSSFMPSLVTLAPAPVAQNETLAPAALSSVVPSSGPSTSIMSLVPSGGGNGTASGVPTMSMASAVPTMGMNETSQAPTSATNQTVTAAPTPGQGNETVSPATMESLVPSSVPGNQTSPGPTFSNAPSVGGGETQAPVPAANAPTSAPGAGTDAPVSQDTLSPSSSEAPSLGGNQTDETSAPTPSQRNETETTRAPSAMDRNDTLATSAPSGMNNTAPTAAPTEIRVRVSNFYIAYVATQDPLVEPTPEQYANQANLTNTFFEDLFGAMFANSSDTTFLGAETTLDYTLFQAGIPAERFNLYMDYAYTDLIYTVDSDPPDAATSFELMRGSISEDFIRNYVWNTTDSAFATVNEVVMRGSDMPNPNNGTQRSDGQIRDGQIQERSGEQDELPVGTLAAAGGAALIIMVVGIVLFRRTRSPTEYMDGIYAIDNKALEGYFGEHSVTEEASENASRFPPLQMVEDDRYDESGSEHQPLREQP